MQKVLELILVAVVAVGIGVFGVVGIGNAASPLKTGPGANAGAAAHNDEGIEHYNQEHWDVAYEHFLEAVKADKNAAEAHYNLALSLDKMGQHMDAAKHFKHAADLGKDNPDIQNSGILHGHLKMLK